jgi:hypothetical protein
MHEILGRCGSLQLHERLGVPFAIVILLIFAGVGIDAIINPRRHMNGYLRSGGELPREWNETAGSAAAGQLGFLFRFERAVPIASASRWTSIIKPIAPAVAWSRLPFDLLSLRADFKTNCCFSLKLYYIS